MPQISGQVVHLDSGATGPVARSKIRRIAGPVAVVALGVPALAAAAVVRGVASIARGGPAPAAPQTMSRLFTRTVLASVVARKMGTWGEAPILFVRIRDARGIVTPARIEGHFVSGALAVGDSVTVRLKVVDGVNVVVDGQNHTVREQIRLSR